MSDKSHTTLRPNGWTLSTFPDGRNVETDTRQCVHCGRHWIVRPGSGKLRGYCANCNGPFCGPACERCLPTEKLLECIEKGIHPDQLPISASVTAAPPTALPDEVVSSGGVILGK